MGKNESTAINQLVDLVQRRPVAFDPGPAEELTFRPPAPRAPAPRMAAPAPRMAAPAPRMAAGTAPPPLATRPVAAWPVLAPAPSEPDDRPTMTFDRAVHGHHAPAVHGHHAPARPVAWMPPPRAPIVAAHPAAPSRPLFTSEEATQAVVPLPHGARPRLRHHLVASLERFALPIALVVVIAGGIGAYLALGRDAAAHPAADAIALAAAPLAAAPAEPPGAIGQVLAGIGEAAPAAAAVRTVTIDSTPPGATATLIASTGATVLGTTPLEASLAAGQAHQVVLSLAGHVDHTATLDPTAPRVSIALVTSIAAVTGVAVAAPAADPAAADTAEIEMPATPRPRASRHRSSSRASSSRAAASRARTVAVREAPAARTAAPTKVAAIPLAAGETKGKGSGKLLVSSNVAAMIYVDGRPTGLTTPQKLSLSAGPHKVTLLDASTRKAKTTTVEIEANGTAKLAREF